MPRKGPVGLQAAVSESGHWHHPRNRRTRTRKDNLKSVPSQLSKKAHYWNLLCFQAALPVGNRCSTVTVNSLSNEKKLSVSSADSERRRISSCKQCKQSHRPGEDSNCISFESSKSVPPPSHLFMSADDPTSYTRANRKLKKAVIEHYRLVKKFMCFFQAASQRSLTSVSHLGFFSGLESLHNYRVRRRWSFRFRQSNFSNIALFRFSISLDFEKL
jgi:hypothetical protein